MAIEDRKIGIGTRNPGLGTREEYRQSPPLPPAEPRSRLIVGLGVTGESVARFLEREHLPFAATDSRPHPPGASAVGETPHAYGHFESPLPFHEIAEAIVSPGVSPAEPFVRELRSQGVPLINDIELFARALLRVPGPGSRVPQVLAITGTNGKSTVVSLVAAMATHAGRNVAAGANLGTPALDLIAPDVEAYVLELSSFQLELTASLAPTAAVVLNVSADHLDRYPSLEAYAVAKARIYAHAGTAVANRDDPVVMQMVRGRNDMVTFGLGEPGSGEYGLRERGGESFLCRGDEVLLAANEVPLAGRHNLANVLAAWALGSAIGLTDEAVREAVCGFHSLPHRLAPAGEHRGVRYFDDSKATNVRAACAALASLPGPMVVIAGGEGKGQDFAPFADCLAGRAQAVVLIGAASDVIEAAIAGRVPVLRADSMEAAVVASAARSVPGGQVVLAPACASFDLFRDYQARGEAFVRAVEALDGD